MYRSYYRKKPTKKKTKKVSDYLHLSKRQVENIIKKINLELLEHEEFDKKFQEWQRKIKPVSEEISQLRIKMNKINKPIQKMVKEGGFFGIGSRFVSVPYTKEEQEALNSIKIIENEITKLELKYNEYLKTIPGHNLKPKITLTNELLILNQVLEKKQKEEDKINKKVALSEQTKAIAATATNKTRDLASNITKNLKISKNCPYCNQIIIDGHWDHIYPISKGGGSTSKNLVFVCSSCNLKKSNLTLSGFIKKFNLDRDKIEANLDFLKKEY